MNQLNMKMVMTIIPQREAERVIQKLVRADFTATIVDSHSGVLRQAQKMLFIVVPATQLDDVLHIIRSNCREAIEVGSQEVNKTDRVAPPLTLGHRPVTAEMGGAVVFIWELDHVETY
jgi:uncharacterized protein YaaQ